MERGSQVSPKILKLECEHEAGPSRAKSHWELQTEPGPSTSQHNCVRSSDAGGDRECHHPHYPIFPHPVGSFLGLLHLHSTGIMAMDEDDPDLWGEGSTG